MFAGRKRMARIPVPGRGTSPSRHLHTNFTSALAEQRFHFPRSRDVASRRASPRRAAHTARYIYACTTGSGSRAFYVRRDAARRGATRRCHQRRRDSASSEPPVSCQNNDTHGNIERVRFNSGIARRDLILFRRAYRKSQGKVRIYISARR